jgi:hypothetical protein
VKLRKLVLVIVTNPTKLVLVIVTNPTKLVLVIVTNPTKLVLIIVTNPTKLVLVIVTNPTNSQFAIESTLDARIPAFHIPQPGPSLSLRTQYFTARSLFEASDM